MNLSRSFPLAAVMILAACVGRHTSGVAEQGAVSPQYVQRAYAERWQLACDRLRGEPRSLIEQMVFRPEEFPYDVWRRAHPEAPDGSLPKAHIRSVVDGHLDEVRRCYDDAKAGWPEAGGRAVVRFGIAPSGNVEAVAAVENDTGIEPITCCLAEAIRSWSFDPPTGGGLVVVTYPFVFVRPGAAQQVVGSEARREHEARNEDTCPDTASSTTVAEQILRAPNLEEWEEAHPDVPKGSLSKSGIKNVIERNTPAVRHCYERVLVGWPGARGRVVIRFVISRSGSVAATAIAANETGVRALGCCIAAQVTKWRFSEPNGGGFVVVEYPFVFKAR